MASISSILALLSCFLLRVFAWIFWKVIPGHHLPPMILISLVIYIGSVGSIVFRTSVPSSSNSSSGIKGAEHDARGPTLRTKKPLNLLTTIFWGLPSPRSGFTTAIPVIHNIFLAIFTIDAILRPPLLYPSNELSLARVGYVSDTTARILIRESDPSQLPLFTNYRQAQPRNTHPWLSGQSLYNLSNETDFTSTVTLDHLLPKTGYEFKVSNNESGYFVTAPSRRDPASNTLSFVTSSCIKPNFPYNPLQHPLHIPGLNTLSTALRTLVSKSKPAFMLFLGDFIYVDVPWRLGSNAAHYRSEYRRIYASPSWPSPEEPELALPWLHVLDDHEIANDWASNTTDPYTAATDPYKSYHVSVNPPVPEDAFPDATYFSFSRGPASFFLLDTRTYRSLDATPPTMVGPLQLKSLLNFVSHPAPTGVKWKFVISSVPFTKNWRVGTNDTWGGYLEERQVVLEAMWEASRTQKVGFVVLSGDRHEFGATKFPEPVTNGGAVVHEFSVGPLSMFYIPWPFRTYKYVDEEDIPIKYLPDGQSKFGVVELENVPNGGPSFLRYRLFIDGKEVWDHLLTSTEGYERVDTVYVKDEL